MDKTVAGQNKCNPKSQDRPFIIEWDATDASQFESITGNDVVFVRYEGCELRIIDSCRNDSQRGAFGSYKPVEWTSGAVEKIDISNEGELYAKLPLGAASLGGRVSAGEQFHMEYFVSGVRTATRPAVYRTDLDTMTGCKGVTHFVYAYNLGAFALGSKKNINAELNANVWGFGGGGTSKQANAAEKRGGQLETCRGESAKELATCKSPIRLTLREIEQGSDPDAKAAVAPETPDALNLAGKIDAKMKRNEKAMEHIRAAQTSANARDGKGCIAELNNADKLDPRPHVLSTNPGSPWSMTRATCLMLAGQCPAGRQLLRKAYEKQATVSGPEALDTIIDSSAGQYCQGGSLTPRDQLLQANAAMQAGTRTKKDPAYCSQAYERVKKASEGVTSTGPDDSMINAAKATDQEYQAAQCYGRAGDCGAAWTMFSKSKMGSLGGKMFKGMVPHCKDFETPSTGPTADPNTLAEQASRAVTLASTAGQKAFKRDASCALDLDQHDRLVSEAQRSTNPASPYATTRVMCLMLAGKCDEGERLQRASLARRNLPGNIIDANLTSMKHDWCK
jgi:hypothetical protein